MSTLASGGQCLLAQASKETEAGLLLGLVVLALGGLLGACYLALTRPFAKPLVGMAWQFCCTWCST